MKNPAHPHAEVIKAWADGAEIQYQIDGDWKDWKCSHEIQIPPFSSEVPYRIKPRTEVVRTKYGYRRYIARNVYDQPIVCLATDNKPGIVEQIDATESVIAWIDKDWRFHFVEVEV